MSEGCLVLFSGGKDSTVALWWAKRKFDRAIALSFNYPRRPKKERAIALQIASEAKVPIIEVDLSFMQSWGDLNVKHSIQSRSDGYIPARNAIFCSVASFFADAHGQKAIVLGHVKSDGESHADASDEFYTQFQAALNIGFSSSFATFGESDEGLSFLRPLATLDDAAAIEFGRELGAPIELSWSCWEDAEEPCGACVSCRERNDAIRAVFGKQE